MSTVVTDVEGADTIETRVANRIIAILLLVIPLSQIALDAYTPALPQMAVEFHASNELVQNTVTAYMLGLAIAFIPLGLISDALGRKRVLLAGLGLLTVTSIGCALAGSLPLLLALRFVQGIGASAWTGELERAHEEILTVRRRCIDHGEEGELSFIDFHSVLIHLWRGSMDDLFLAVLRAGAEVNLDRQREALADDQPLHALWQHNNAHGARLLMEFMALANHRKEIRSEIIGYAARFGDMEESAVTLAMRAHGVDTTEFPPVVMSMIVTSLARILVLERSLGITRGHGADAGQRHAQRDHHGTSEHKSWLPVASRVNARGYKVIQINSVGDNCNGPITYALLQQALLFM